MSIIELQVDLMAQYLNRSPVMVRIDPMITIARDAQVSIIWIQHNDTNLSKRSPQWRMAPGLKPKPEELLTQKKFNSASEQTVL